MGAEQRTCQNCKNPFTIEPEDFSFYEKVKAPPPTWCPDCRAQRRMMWRCERSLYKRPCDLCGTNIISIYSSDKPYKVYCRDCYYGDKWNPLNFGMEVDFSKPFLAQLKELQRRVPRQYAFVFQNANSEYTNGSAFNKNCYLIFVSDHNEDSLYSYTIFDCRNSMDLMNCNECELCYECITCKKCYQVSFSEDCSNSQNAAFCKNCANCHDCIGCVNLRNAQYCIFNVQYTKDDYLAKLKELHLGSRAGLGAVWAQTVEFRKRFPVKYIHGFQNTNVIGDYTFNSKNAKYVYNSELLEDSKFINHGNKAKDCYDAYVLVDNSQNSYEVIGSITLNNVKFSALPWNCFNADYVDLCENSSNLFGCVSVRKKEYCILNKQYSKEEYEALRTKIIGHMNAMPYVDGKGRRYGYGEYLPPDLSPFAYNETVANEYYPLTRESTAGQGYAWKDPEEKAYHATMESNRIPDTIEGVGDAITKEIIGCAHGGRCNDGCVTAFKVVPAELQFYKRTNIPLPTLCLNCRHYKRLRQRNPLKLWHRTCGCGGVKSGNGVYQNAGTHVHSSGRCPNEFETTYAPERPEIVYCEQCYQAEVA